MSNISIPSRRCSTTALPRTAACWSWRPPTSPTWVCARCAQRSCGDTARWGQMTRGPAALPPPCTWWRWPPRPCTTPPPPGATSRGNSDPLHRPTILCRSSPTFQRVSLEKMLPTSGVYETTARLITITTFPLSSTSRWRQKRGTWGRGTSTGRLGLWAMFDGVWYGEWNTLRNHWSIGTKNSTHCCSPVCTDEASHVGSRGDNYSSAFLWFSAPQPLRLWTKLNILVCYCCSSWPGLPEPPSLRSRSKQRSHSFRALPASKSSSVRMCVYCNFSLYCQSSSVEVETGVGWSWSCMQSVRWSLAGAAPT